MSFAPEAACGALLTVTSMAMTWEWYQKLKKLLSKTVGQSDPYRRQERFETAALVVAGALASTAGGGFTFFMCEQDRQVDALRAHQLEDQARANALEETAQGEFADEELRALSAVKAGTLVCKGLPNGKVSTVWFKRDDRYFVIAAYARRIAAFPYDPARGLEQSADAAAANDEIDEIAAARGKLDACEALIEDTKTAPGLPKPPVSAQTAPVPGK